VEAVIFVGIQGSGKTTFYKERFFETHIRLSLDMLRTRHRLRLLLRACIEARQPFVVDNTNVTVAERAEYIEAAKAAGFRVIGYFFASPVHESARRNELRTGRQRIPLKGVYGTAKRLQPPTLEEGFDAIYRVVIDAARRFVVDPV
jgi:predicted kinase